MTLQIDIFLQPGEVYFGDRETRIRTLLGSCIAVTWWHPTRQVGGMCHYLLPQRSQSQQLNMSNLDGRYAEEAFLLAMHYIQTTGTLPADYQVKMFGGGHVLIADVGKTLAVGERNIEFGKKWLAGHGFRVSREHVAGHGHRHIVFDVATGDVWVRFSPQHEGVPSSKP
ncbi:chemotaxis protein CheD [Chitinimonas sp. BJB300]|uniref:chemotaxis protein CheD n=1 Tax=Chitinimonas sp. BJB300 TaxID=1559339 RepID=UPI000C1062A0|nr:chemotaxis protein CheD [Chitinimonas sp. BJB300]PHV13054.1 chemotaxis protein CheD [Chitinimonas sp. BJB300]TSJ87736.1 chemotaxis protein CheD [Chitinimonas sp. BJB300]